MFCLAVEAHVKNVARLYDFLGGVTKGVLYFEGNSNTDVMQVQARLSAQSFSQIEYLGMSDDDYLARNNCRPLFIARKQ